jgi:hypothetical protein
MFTLGRFWKDGTGGTLNLSNDGVAELIWRELGIEKRHYAAKRSLEVLEDLKKALEEYKEMKSLQICLPSSKMI